MDSEDLYTETIWRVCAVGGESVFRQGRQGRVDISIVSEVFMREYTRKHNS